MKKRKNFRRRPKKELQGLQVEVYNNEVEKAMRILKRKVKDSNLFIDLGISDNSTPSLFTIQATLRASELYTFL